MNIYKALKLVTGKKMPAWIKLLGLWGMHVTRRRMIGIFLDPVMSCNLRCRMCYFSDPGKRKEMHGIMTDERLGKIEKALFHRALKLQIGCGAEPTLSKKLPDIISSGKKAGIPYISLTTNGQLLADNSDSLMRLAECGLNEITLSMHGTEKDTYEFLMPGARFDRLISLIRIIGQVKSRFPGLVFRINYTINSLNVDNLKGDNFWALFENDAFPDIIQLRPVQNMGNTEWSDFNLQPLKDKYDETIAPIIAECRHRNITCIAPSLQQIDAVNNDQDSFSALIEDISYCYIDPNSCYSPQFDLDNDTYESYHKRQHTARRLLANAILRRNRSRLRHASKKLNYTVD